VGVMVAGHRGGRVVGVVGIRVGVLRVGIQGVVQRVVRPGVVATQVEAVVRRMVGVGVVREAVAVAGALARAVGLVRVVEDTNRRSSND